MKLVINIFKKSQDKADDSEKVFWISLWDELDMGEHYTRTSILPYLNHYSNILIDIYSTEGSRPAGDFVDSCNSLVERVREMNYSKGTERDLLVQELKKLVLKLTTKYSTLLNYTIYENLV